MIDFKTSRQGPIRLESRRTRLVYPFPTHGDRTASQTTSSCSPPSRSPRATRTRWPTRSPTACSTPSWRDDPTGRVACETLVNTGLVVVSGEITTETYVDVPKIARETIRRIGYDDAAYGFDCDACAVITAIDEQSPDIAQGVDEAFETRTDASRRRRARRGRRRRPGHDVRLRHARDARADAAADLAGAQAGPPPGRGPPRAGGRLPAPRRQDPGHRPLRETASRSRSRRS